MFWVAGSATLPRVEDFSMAPGVKHSAGHKISVRIQRVWVMTLRKELLYTL